ncbi:hypothetical protein VP01_655g4 [Puccinia sorghi]|uniref:Uncharacterized protein n=1 Tax=Puccinia sorghi TaxID=27349 RepID=A0A0L6UG78_9BASI|nr:hypothetical protein VP01_655g4 [Puccinia sorghi]
MEGVVKWSGATYRKLYSSIVKLAQIFIKPVNLIMVDLATCTYCLVRYKGDPLYLARQCVNMAFTLCLVPSIPNNYIHKKSTLMLVTQNVVERLRNSLKKVLINNKPHYYFIASQFRPREEIKVAPSLRNYFPQLIICFLPYTLLFLIDETVFQSFMTYFRLTFGSHSAFPRGRPPRKPELKSSCDLRISKLSKNHPSFAVCIGVLDLLELNLSLIGCIKYKKSTIRNQFYFIKPINYIMVDLVIFDTPSYLYSSPPEMTKLESKIRVKGLGFRLKAVSLKKKPKKLQKPTLRVQVFLVPNHDMEGQIIIEIGSKKSLNHSAFKRNHTCCDFVLAVVLGALSLPCNHDVWPYIMKTQRNKIDTLALEDFETGLGESGRAHLPRSKNRGLDSPATNSPKPRFYFLFSFPTAVIS